LSDTGLGEAELWIGEMRGVVVDGCPVLLVRHEHGVAAFQDRCPHQGFPLSEGELVDGVITCRAHRHSFDAASGHGINPRRPCLVALPLRLSDGRIIVEPKVRP
jgi:toluene monooxygenase system ferredoxin subunit